LLKRDNHIVKVFAKDKDVLINLLNADDVDFVNVLQIKKRDKFSVVLSLLVREVVLGLHALKFKPDLIIGTDPIVAHIGKLLKIPNIITLEDDFDVIPKLARIAYPFCANILVPTVCKVGAKFENKKIGYNGYMKLAYLHPNVFNPIEIKEVKKPYFLLRLSSLKAHHDADIKGVSNDIIDIVISMFEKYGTVYISSERKLPENLEVYRLNVNKSQIHSVLFNTELFISDSQSMSVEAAMLGITSIRFNDFVGKISVLEELEHKYKLTFGIPTSKPNDLIDKIKELLDMPDRRDVFQARRQKMLADKIDVTAFMVWFIENYPKSVGIMKENPDYQYRFK